MYTAGSGYAEARHGKHSTPHLLGQKGRATQDAPPRGAHTHAHMPLPPHARCHCPQPLLSAPPCKPWRTTAWRSFLGSAGRASRPAVAPPARYLVAGPPASQSTRHSPRVVPRLLNTPGPRPPTLPGERAQRGSPDSRARACVTAWAQAAQRRRRPPQRPRRGRRARTPSPAPRGGRCPSASAAGRDT